MSPHRSSRPPRSHRVPWAEALIIVAGAGTGVLVNEATGQADWATGAALATVKVLTDLFGPRAGKDDGHGDGRSVITHLVSCADCGAPTTEGPETPLEQRQPCACGGMNRAVAVTASDSATLTERSSWLMSFARSPRPWQEMWSYVEHGLTEIEDYYVGRGTRTSTAFSKDVKDFFVVCYQLKDYLKKDPAIAASIQDAVEPYVHASAALDLAGDIANTYKHHSREPSSKGRPPKRSVDIISMTSALTATFGWTDPATGQLLTCDALELAREAVADWRAFLRANQLSP